MSNTQAYPHTTIQDDLTALRNMLMLDSQVALAQKILDEYQSKKAWYTSRIAELEEAVKSQALITAGMRVNTPTSEVSSSTASSSTASSGTFSGLAESFNDTAKVAEGGYPHTRIQANVDRLRSSLMASSSGARQERLDALEDFARDYGRKRAWFTVARRGEDAEYPHTACQEFLDNLEELLEESSSPRRQERLDLVAALRTDYLRKRDWFTTLPSFNG